MKLWKINWRIQLKMRQALNYWKSDFQLCKQSWQDSTVLLKAKLKCTHRLKNYKHFLIHCTEQHKYDYLCLPSSYSEHANLNHAKNLLLRIGFHLSLLRWSWNIRKHCTIKTRLKQRNQTFMCKGQKSQQVDTAGKLHHCCELTAHIPA